MKLDVFGNAPATEHNGYCPDCEACREEYDAEHRAMYDDCVAERKEDFDTYEISRREGGES